VTRALAFCLAVLALAAAAPAAAQAQAVVLGSPLQNPPNAGFGCETRFQPLGGSIPGTQYGDLVATASGTPDCTWFLNGVWGVIDPAVDPRIGTVPGDGTITRISVRSGPNPAPIRFVVGRNLHTICCFFVAETSISQPQPNTVTSFNVNLPVERNTDVPTNIRTDDFVGVSAAGPGTLPIASVGPHNTLMSVQGNPNAGSIYPRLSSASDLGGGVRPDGNPGFEVLMQVTFCPAGQPCVPGAGGGGGGGGAGGGGGGNAVAPVLGRPVFGPRVFRVAPGATPRVAARVKAGTTLSFTLDKAATVKIAIQRPAAGKRSKGKCRKPTPKLAKAKRCTRWVGVGTLTRKNMAAGAAKVPFTGRIGKKALKPGSYRAAITPTSTDGAKGKARIAKFTVVR
jgi:hypothetical protein